MDYEIKRDYYLEQLIKRKNNGLIKVVTGIRRCGKSFLLRTLYKKYLLETGVDESHIIEMAFDLFDTIGIRKHSIRGPKNKLKMKGNIIFFWTRCSC